MIRYVDAHCHLDLFPNYGQVAQEAVESETAVVTVTTTPRAWPQNAELARAFPNVIAALGLHPQLVASHSAEIALFDEYLREAHFVGEIGLDATRPFYSSFDLQRKVFQEVLEACARAGGKVLTIHSVRTAKIVLDMIVQSKILESDCIVILHWFTGPRREAERALELGCFFSINGAMLNRPELEQLLIEMPLDRVLTESDGPFARVHGILQTPGSMSSLVEDWAAMRKIDKCELATVIVANFRSLLASKSDHRTG